MSRMYLRSLLIAGFMCKPKIVYDIWPAFSNLNNMVDLYRLT